MPADQRARLAAADKGGYVLGGNATVPDSRVAGREMKRLGGATRWETAQLVGRRATGASTTGTSASSAARLEQHARVDNQHEGSVEAERTLGGLNSALIKFLADRLMLSEEFVCQSLAGAMYVEGLANGLIGSAYERLEGSPPVRSIDELADELRGCDTALACAFCDDGRNVVGQVNNRGHRPQRTYRPRQVSTDFSVAMAEAWLLADADGCAHHFGVSRTIAPCDVELLCDPERPLANLCRRSGMPGVREGMLPRQGSRRSAGESYRQLAGTIDHNRY